MKNKKIYIIAAVIVFLIGAAIRFNGTRLFYTIETGFFTAYKILAQGDRPDAAPFLMSSFAGRLPDYLSDCLLPSVLLMQAEISMQLRSPVVTKQSLLQMAVMFVHLTQKATSTG